MSFLEDLKARITRAFGASTSEERLGNRRVECWWEASYDPNLDDKTKLGAWPTVENQTIEQRYFIGNTVSANIKEVDSSILKLIRFSNCDFQGRFDPNCILIFDQCHFYKCDFGYSIWKDAHFKNCEFRGCSLSIAAFERCQFRNNKWEKVSYSGSKTEFLNSFISNPHELIKAGYSGVNPADGTQKHYWYQAYRLEETKAGLSRKMVRSQREAGEDRDFYNAIRTSDLQQTKADIAKHLYNLAFDKWSSKPSALIKFIFFLIERILSQVIGWINLWGRSSLMPLILIILNVMLYSLIYYFGFETPNYATGFQKSFNIAILAGYSSELSHGNSLTLNILQNVQATISIILYSVFFGTIIARFARVR